MIEPREGEAPPAHAAAADVMVAGAGGATRWRPRRAVVLLSLVAAALAAASWLGSYDDAYITYTYARNLAAGRGWSWAGERVLGTTSPLFAALLAGLQSAAPFGVPVWGHLVSWFATLGTSLCLLSLGRREGWPHASLAAAFLWLPMPLVLRVLGSEYLAGMACVAAAALAMTAGRSFLAGLALAGAVGLRPELGVAAVVLAARAFVQRGGRDGAATVARTAAVALAVWGAWLVALWLTAGTIVPTTWAAKQAQGASPFWGSGVGLLRAARDHGRAFFFPHALTALLAGAGLGMLRPLFALRRWGTVATIAAWGAGHLLLLIALRVPYYHWYVVPGYLAVIVLVAVWVEPPGTLAAGRRWWAGVTAVLVVATLAPDVWNHLHAVARDPIEARARAYRAMATWIDERYPAATTVGSFEVGYLGYWGAFRTVDFLGLVNPRVPLDAVARGDLSRVWAANRPDLLFTTPGVDGLVFRLVGDPLAFVAAYQLEAVQLRPMPPVVVYRRHDVAPRGEVLADLLPAAAGAGKSIVFDHRGGFGGPTLVLSPGESLAIPSPQTRSCVLAVGVAARGRGGAQATVAVAGAGTTGLPAAVRVADADWTPINVAVPAGPEATLVLACGGGSASECAFVIPHLRRTPL